jgi:hypothetical protein
MRTSSQKSLSRPLKGRGQADRFITRECQKRRSSSKPAPGNVSGARRYGGVFRHLPLRRRRHAARGRTDGHDHHRRVGDPQVLPGDRLWSRSRDADEAALAARATESRRFRRHHARTSRSQEQLRWQDAGRPRLVQAPAGTQPAFDSCKGARGRRGSVRDLHGRRVGGRESHRQQPLLRPLGEVSLRCRSRHPPRRIRRHRCRLFYLRRWHEFRRGRKAKPRRPRTPEREPVRRRPTRPRERQRPTRPQERQWPTRLQESSRWREPRGGRCIISLPRPRRRARSKRPGIRTAGCGTRICPTGRGTRIRSTGRRTRIRLAEGQTAGCPLQRLASSRPVTSSHRLSVAYRGACRGLLRSRREGINLVGFD